MNAEIDKLEEQSDNLEELGEFLGAVADRLKALQFGIFAARSKKRRDEMVIAVRSLQAGVISVDKEAERAMSNLQEKLTSAFPET